MQIKEENFGNLPTGERASLFILSNPSGIEVGITNYGGIITYIHAPDRNGVSANIVAGFRDLDGYLSDHPYFGAIVGRVANRISGAQFKLGKKTFNLATNQFPNHLHGGIKGFDKQLWSAKTRNSEGVVELELNYLSRHLEEGYPGNLECKAVYILDNQNALTIHFHASTDDSTPINLTNHSYFNLTGFSDRVYNHNLQIEAANYTEVDEASIPTGRILPVKDSFLDFRKSRPVGEKIKLTGIGYDHNYVLNRPGRLDRRAVEIVDPSSGRAMEVYTTQPGLQLYTGNYLNGVQGSHTAAYQQHYAFCLETQHFPDSPNRPEFPSIILNPGEEYDHKTIFKFITDN